MLEFEAKLVLKKGLVPVWESLGTVRSQVKPCWSGTSVQTMTVCRNLVTFSTCAALSLRILLVLAGPVQSQLGSENKVENITVRQGETVLLRSVHSLPSWQVCTELMGSAWGPTGSKQQKQNGWCFMKGVCLQICCFNLLHGSKGERFKSNLSWEMVRSAISPSLRQSLDSNRFNFPSDAAGKHKSLEILDLF